MVKVTKREQELWRKIRDRRPINLHTTEKEASHTVIKT